MFDLDEAREMQREGAEGEEKKGRAIVVVTILSSLSCLSPNPLDRSGMKR